MRRPVAAVRLMTAVLAYMFVMSAFDPAPAVSGHITIPDSPPPAALHPSRA